MSQTQNAITPESFDAVLFDLDGVLTDTAKVHATCWKRMFDDFLQQRARANNEPFQAFEIETDYNLYVDGKPRFDGVRSFLLSRQIQLPEGTPADAAESETICGLGNRKNDLVNHVLETEGVEAYPGSVKLVKRLREQGIKTAVVSSSANCETVLRAAGILELFDARVDGNVASRMKLAGKPAPDTYLKAAELLAVPPQRAVVVEDAISGVQSGRAGSFGLVVGVARHDNAEELKQNGATLVVTDLGDLA
jgi:beta-phosphoglucomutase family hydrolase